MVNKGAAPPVKLQLQLDAKTLLVFIFFFFLMHEFHELAHIITGRLICGCWGPRDFNVWQLCADCPAKGHWGVLATLAGPLFTFLMLWAGRYLVKKGPLVTHRALGLVFIFGNMQFGRMYMAAMGSGDELTGLRSLLLKPDHSNASLLQWMTVMVVSLICIPPLATAYQTIANPKRIGLFTALLVLPLILDTAVILMGLNGLLHKGLLEQVWVMGSPLLITVWGILCLLVTGFHTKTLMRFARLPAKP